MEDDNEELFWDTSDLINDYLSENHQTVVINFAYLINYDSFLTLMEKNGYVLKEKNL